MKVREARKAVKRVASVAPGLKVKPGEVVEGHVPPNLCLCCGRELGADTLVRRCSIDLSERGCYVDHLVMAGSLGTDSAEVIGWVCCRCLRSVERVWERMRDRILTSARRTN